MNILKIMLLTFFLFGVYNASFAASSPDNDIFINLDFHDAPVRDILQTLAQFKHLNLILSDSVKGNMSVHIEHMPWQKALAVILQDQGLGQQQTDGVLTIAPLAEITARETQAWQARQTLEKLAPLQSVFIPIRYGKAQEIADLLSGQNTHLLSPRGTASADPRTNMLWVQDTPTRLSAIREFIQQVDIPVKQVLIEARIVSIDKNYEQELGVRFGLSRPDNQLTGTLAGANNLANNQINNPLDRLNVDLPATGVGAAGGAPSIGIALAKLGGGNLLDLELSAMETEGAGEIISSPRLITGNQQAASILSGQEIPYQAATSSGATSVNFQKAVLSLSVTPQITPDGRLLLDLKVNQDHPTTTLVHGVPSIETRALQTQVWVNNGQTVVLGGIYEQTKEHTLQKVPWLGDLPLVGALFRHTASKDRRRELLIFVTPTIMTPALESLSTQKAKSGLY